MKMSPGPGRHRAVAQENPDEPVPGEYVFKPEDLFEIWFGFSTGVLNTMRVGTDLYVCGRNLRSAQ